MSERVPGADTIAALQEEVVQLRHAVTAHAVVDQAIGVVIACAGVCPDAAWEILKEVSQHTNIKLRTVAQHLVCWPSSRRLPAEVRGALDTAVRARGAHAAGFRRTDPAV